MKKQLYKSDNKAIAGVLAGVAEYFGWDITWTRLIYSALTLMGFGSGIILYIIAAIIIPNRPERRNIDAQESDQK
ncbi:PspC domain-containing protein [Lactobacillaceae bacterium Scapto_B20]